MKNYVVLVVLIKLDVIYIAQVSGFLDSDLSKILPLYPSRRVAVGTGSPKGEDGIPRKEKD